MFKTFQQLNSNSQSNAQKAGHDSPAYESEPMPFFSYWLGSEVAMATPVLFSFYFYQTWAVSELNSKHISVRE